MKTLNYQDWNKYYESTGSSYNSKIAILESSQFILEQKSSDAKLLSLIEKAKGNDSDKVKGVDGYSEVMAWFEAGGPTGKVTRTTGKKKGTSYKPEFKGSKEDLIKSLTYWNGDLSGKVTGGKDNYPIEIVKEWLALPEGEIYNTLIKAGKRNNKARPKAWENFENDFTRIKKVVPEADIRSLLEQIVELMEGNVKSGKSLKGKVEEKWSSVRYYSNNLVKAEAKTETSTFYLCAIPMKGKHSQRTPKGIVKEANTNDLGVWKNWIYKYIGVPKVETIGEGKDKKKVLKLTKTDEALENKKAMIESFGDKQYFVSKAVGITDFDKAKMLKLIVQKSDKVNLDISLATNIRFKPTTAKTTEKTEKVKGEPNVIITKDSFSFPDADLAISDPDQFAKESMIMYLPDSNTAQQGMEEKLRSVLVKELKKIKDDGGKILSFSSQIVSSTSVIPSRYLGDGKKGSNYSYENNVTLAKDRGADMKSKLDAAMTDPIVSEMLEGITPNIQIQNKANNPGNVEDGGFATKEDAIKFYEDLKKNNGGKASNDPNWNAKGGIRAKRYAPQRHSGILFQVKVEYKEITPTEEEVTTEEIIGEWKVYIDFPSKSSSSSSKRRKRRRRRWKIDWFPGGGGRPGGGGHSVKDLCAAYG